MLTVRFCVRAASETPGTTADTSKTFEVSGNFGNLTCSLQSSCKEKTAVSGSAARLNALIQDHKTLLLLLLLLLQRPPSSPCELAGGSQFVSLFTLKILCQSAEQSSDQRQGHSLPFSSLSLPSQAESYDNVRLEYTYMYI